MQRLYDVFLRGGWVMWPILALSLLAVAIAIERLLALARETTNADLVLDELKQSYAGGGPEALRRVDTARGAAAELTEIAANHAGDARHELESLLSAAGNELIGRLEAPLNALRAIADIEPLLGFFGTVIGMIAAFDAIVAQGTGDARVIAGGISVALITTAGGLAVAIPTYLAHGLLSARLDRVTTALDRIAAGLVRLLCEGVRP